jgi:hypothetical protein
METAYTFTVNNNEVIFTKDDEIVAESFDRLVIMAMDFFNYSMEDAEHYARWLINSCLDCYKKELEDRRK